MSDFWRGPVVDEQVSIRSLLERRAARDPNRCYLTYRDERVTFAALETAVNRLANGLHRAGVTHGTRVAVMLDNHPDHVRVFFALAKLGAVQLPINTRLRNEPLRYVLDQGAPSVLIAESHYLPALELALEPMAEPPGCFVRGDASSHESFATLKHGASDAPPPGAPRADDVLTVLFTSGTTGPPKGVQVTDKMHRVCGLASALAADVQAGDVMYTWEPLYHVGATEVLVLALERAVQVALTDTFSASRFWHECRACGATQIHFLGGILQMLLAQPMTDDERAHRVRVAWGGGAPPSVWRAFEDRFGIQVRENYGMTEASSLTSINCDVRFGTVGRPVPWFDVQIADVHGHHLPTGERGEIVVRGREPGLITPGYFRNPQATAQALRNGWLHTGDLGLLDADGYLHFLGRLKDCIRRRGENISAWEIEHVVDAMAAVAESAAVGVPGELGDEEIKLFVKTANGQPIDPQAIIAWCRDRLAPFQVPLYLAVVDDFEKTGTQRIRKETLSRALDDCWVRSTDG